jgi:hypothetical protein
MFSRECTTKTFIGVQHNPLPGRGQPVGVIQVHSFALIENREVMTRMPGEADHIAHRQHGAPPVSPLPAAASSSPSVVVAMIIVVELLH